MPLLHAKPALPLWVTSLSLAALPSAARRAHSPNAAATSGRPHIHRAWRRIVPRPHALPELSLTHCLATHPRALTARRQPLHGPGVWACRCRRVGLQPRCRNAFKPCNSFCIARTSARLYCCLLTAAGLLGLLRLPWGAQQAPGSCASESMSCSMTRWRFKDL